MLNSCGSTQEGHVSKSRGDVLTVVDTPMQSKLNLMLGEARRPIHLESLAAAISLARKVPVRAVLLGPAVIGPELSASVATLANECAGAVLVAVIAGWTPALPEKLLAFGGYGIRDAVDLSRREGLHRLRTLLTDGEWDLGHRIAITIQPCLEMATFEMRLFMSNLIRTAPFVSSLRAFAGQLRIRHSSLSSRFFRARLPSPKQYLAETRLVYAAGVLSNPSVSVAQASRRLHYSSPQGFGRHVREQMGISAMAFREQYPFEAMASRLANRLLLPHQETLRWFVPVERRVLARNNTMHRHE